MLVGSSIFDCIEMLVLDFIVVVDSVFHVNAESILLKMRNGGQFSLLYIQVPSALYRCQIDVLGG